MAHFYGRLQGNRGEATRCGSKDSGIHTTAESWTSVVRVRMGEDRGDQGVHARISVEGKYSGTALTLILDTDLIADHRNDPRVQGAIHAMAVAADALNAAAREARADELERRGQDARDALATLGGAA